MRWSLLIACLYSATDAGTCPADMAAIPGTGACIDRYEASLGKGGAARSVKGVVPAARVSQDEARRACEGAGKHLCSEQEWVAACQGLERRHYPYGNDFKPRVCNDWDLSEHGKKGAVRTGTAPGCVTPEGVFDLQGNVAEWTATEEARAPGLFAVRGGTYNMTVGEDSFCDGDDYRVKKDNRTPDVGFRCCR